MLSNIGKKGKLAAIVLSSALSVTLVSPASAIVPDGAPVGTQDFVSNGKSTMIYGSGSDTTYPMQQALATIFNRAPGCTLQTVASGDQQYTMECNPTLNATAGKAPGYANYDRDLASEYYFIGSGGGRNHVAGWNQGTTGYSQADYFRSSSSSSFTDARMIAFARDALAAFVFDGVKIGQNTVVTPGDSVADLSTNQLKAIWGGTTKCWASIDITLSGLAGVRAGTDATYVTDSKFDEAKWLPLATAAKGANYDTSDAYKACTPIAVYTVNQTSGTAQYWNTGVLAGTSSNLVSEAFLSQVDPFTGDLFTAGEVTQRKIPENNASPIANRLNTAGINTDLVTNAIYFYSIGKYTTALGGLDGNGNPVLEGNSTRQSGFTDRLMNVTGGVAATAANIAATSNGYAYARSLFFGYQYPNQATRNYLDPINGFLCSTKTDDMVDPINSFNVRDQIETAILSSGFIPLPSGAVGGGLTGNSYCRQSTVTALLTDSASPTAGIEINTATDGATAQKPIFTATFNELVSGVTESSVGIQEYNGDVAVGDPIAATLVCTNARQAVIPCLAATSTTNYDRAPLEFVKKVTVQPIADLPGGKSYKAFALGTVAATVAIQDRAGLAGWPIVDGNPAVNQLSASHAVPVVEVPVVTPPVVAPAKASQTAAAVPATLKAKKKLTIKATNSVGLAVKVTASGCKVKPVVKTTKKKVGKKTVKTKTTTGYSVTMGKKGSTCTVTQSNAGDATYNPLNAVTAITVK